MSIFDKNPIDGILALDSVKEAKDIIEALAPKSAPDDLSVIKGVTDLKIIKSNILPSNTICVSKDLFDVIYNVSVT